MNSENLEQLQISHDVISNLLSVEPDNKNHDKIVTEYITSCKRIPVEDFPEDLEWFSVSQSLSFAKHLKGKVVVLDFFTYCCINCMHILPELKAIENEFSIEDGLVVIGVHSAKFDNEKLSTNILSAIQRYNICHPVVNDAQSQMWNKCGVTCWPTLLILSPQGIPLIMLLGEGHLEDLRLYIRNSLNYFKSINEISNHSLPTRSSFHLLPELKGPLLFPGKITSYVDNDNNNFDKLAISDTGNHRILITTLDGSLLYSIGGSLGCKDGNFSEARFNAPQGLVFQNEHTLFVADTENHAIRKIDFNLGIVITVAGTGEQGIDRVGGKIGTEQVISSPWDVCIYKTPDMDMSFHLPSENVIEKDILIIAMAGTHQIWALFLDDLIWWKFKRHTKGTCMCIVGSGREENRNNTYAHLAGFAQPSGLTICKERKELYVADSESSTIRRLSLIDGKVSAVVGGEKNPLNLFGFGDIDGKLSEAKLQHPLGVAMSKDEQFLFVADTYNHKIKLIDISTNSVSTLRWAGVGHMNDFVFNEPSGLCITGEERKLYVTDTNNHCIKIIQLSDDFHIREINKFNLKLKKSMKLSKFDKSRHTVLPAGNLKLNLKGGKIILGLKCLFDDKTSLTVDAPTNWSVICPNILWSAAPQSGNDINLIDTVINAGNTIKECSFYVVYNFVICKGDMCIPKNLAVEFKVQFLENGPIELCKNITICTGLHDSLLN